MVEGRGIGDLARPHPPLLPRLPNGRREWPVVRGRNEVDRRAQQRALHDRPLLQCRVEVGPRKTVHPRPQSDVHRRRVLRLEPAHLLEHRGDRQPRWPQQELAVQQGEAQLALRKSGHLTGQYVTGFVREYAGTDRRREKESLMAAVKPIPDNYPRVTAYLAIDGAGDAIDFYKKIFGAQERVRMPGPDGRIGHAEIGIGDSVIMMADTFPEMGHVDPKKL